MNKVPTFKYKISFPNLDSSSAVRWDIERYLVRLDRLCGRITYVDVSVRVLHKHKRKRIYHIDFFVQIPGGNIVVSHTHERNFAHADIHIAIRDSFRSLYRKVRKRLESRRDRRLKELGPVEWGGC